MNRSEVNRSVVFLLEELYDKKRWLDMMIQGLEAAVESPEHRLIASVEEAFAGKKLDSVVRTELQSDRDADLVKLARHVRSTPSARRRRSLKPRQAAST